MDSSMQQRLLQINRRFYRHFAHSFDSSRHAPWPGWQRVVQEHVQSVVKNLPNQEPLRVLDLGCGNGRFGKFLAQELHYPIHYTGLDTSVELLASAAQACEDLEQARLVPFDLVRDDLNHLPELQLQDVVVLFGVTHHLPGASFRRTLLGRFARLLRPAARLVFSVWRLDQTPRFERKALRWEDFNNTLRQRGEEPLDLSQLEPGDHLLTWAGDRSHPRYCHFPTEEEVTSWIASMGLRVIDRFSADGPGQQDNLYWVLERSWPDPV